MKYEYSYCENIFHGLYSNLPYILYVAIKVHMILGRYVVSTQMHDIKRRDIVQCDNKYNDDNVMRATVWLEFYGKLL